MGRGFDPALQHAMRHAQRLALSFWFPIGWIPCSARFLPAFVAMVGIATVMAAVLRLLGFLRCVCHKRFRCFAG